LGLAARIFIARKILLIQVNAVHPCWRYHYDGFGRLARLTNENGTHTHFAWDKLDRLKAEQGFDNRRIDYRYNASGHLLEMADGVPQGAGWMSHGPTTLRTHYQRDALGRLRERPPLSLRPRRATLAHRRPPQRPHPLPLRRHRQTHPSTRQPRPRTLRLRPRAQPHRPGLCPVIPRHHHPAHRRNLGRLRPRPHPRPRLQPPANLGIPIDDHRKGPTRYHYDAIGRLTQALAQPPRCLTPNGPTTSAPTSTTPTSTPCKPRNPWTSPPNNGAKSPTTASKPGKTTATNTTPGATAPKNAAAAEKSSATPGTANTN